MRAPIQLSLPFPRRPAPRLASLAIGRRTYLIEIARVRRARRYVLRVRPDGSLRVAIPPGGSIREAMRFVRAQRAWIDRERLRLLSHPRAPAEWSDGTVILLRGRRVTLRVVTEDGNARPAAVIVGGEAVPLAGAPRGIRGAVERHLQRLAAAELPARLLELAAAHGFRVAHVRIGDQRSLWGSCSRPGRVSLNWRLVQMPPEVRDYVLLHELTHLRVADHSPRFWRLLDELCPWRREAQAWLRAHGGELY
ncbi:MAG TPA: SprT family zinc-dependent metalloprotease [Vicinamibacterales bacterium]|nr:SprT family zinc-dependent metalloprotease [Vicinamibacterales bacterium]